jgi:RNA polymerase sigma-70 factor, ECF subfamily
MNFLAPRPLPRQRLLDLKQRSDEELAQEARYRSEAFAELYQRNLKTVYRYHLSRVGNVYDAQDLTAKTFLAAQEAIASFRGRGKFAAWLMGIASRKTIDYFRCQRSTLPLEAADEVANDLITPEEFAEQQLSLEQVAHALSRLTVDRAEAIAAAFMIPTLTSGRTTRWLTALFNSGIDSKANAQTLAQAFATGQVTLTADTQESNETTQEVMAIGNAVLAFPDAQIQAKANQIQYVPTARQFTLLGNVEISQRGENLRGSQASCSLVEKQCSLTQE